MTTGDVEQRVETYLSRLSKCLRGLSEEEVRDITAELRGHIVDKATVNGEMAPEAVAAALVALGSPEELAGEYLTDNVLARAEVSRSPLRILKSLFRWAGLSVAGFFVFIGSLFGYALSAALMWCAVLKPIFPATDGLWVSNGTDGPDLSFHLGFSRPLSNSHEVLGWWIVPIGLIGGYGLLMLTTRLTLWCIGSYRRSRSLPRG